MLKKLPKVFCVCILICIAVYIGFYFGRMNSQNTSFSPDNPYSSNDHSNDQTFVKYDLNTVTEDELCKIPGVGRALAREIIEYREIYGRYYDVKELKYFDSVSNGLYETFLKYVTVYD